jgi:calcineurin-like phosphoesterase family protein
MIKFTDSEQSRCFFISDSHFSHRKIIEYCNRPFATAEDMDREMIKRWNAKVRKNDNVFFLGDFCFGRDSIDPSIFLAQLNGNIYFIKGNHDHIERLASCPSGIRGFWDILNITINAQKIVLCHYPMISWQGKEDKAWMLFGHCHNSYQAPDDQLSYNVGVEWINYTPISFTELGQIMTPKREKFLKKQQEREEAKNGAQR